MFLGFASQSVSPTSCFQIHYFGEGGRNNIENLKKEQKKTRQKREKKRKKKRTVAHRNFGRSEPNGGPEKTLGEAQPRRANVKRQIKGELVFLSLFF